MLVSIMVGMHHLSQKLFILAGAGVNASSSLRIINGFTFRFVSKTASMQAAKCLTHAGKDGFK